MKINDDARNIFELLTHIVQSTEEQFIPHAGELVQVIWPTLQSPVTFSHARDLYVALVPVIFMNDKDTFGQYILR